MTRVIVFAKKKSSARQHTIVNVKECVNFASANYLGLIELDKLIVSTKEIFFF